MASKLVAALVASTVCAAPVLAADIYWADPIGTDFAYVYPTETLGDPIEAGDVQSFAQMPHLRIQGRIEAGDAAKVEAMLWEEKPNWNADMFKC